MLTGLFRTLVLTLTVIGFQADDVSETRALRDEGSGHATEKVDIHLTGSIDPNMLESLQEAIARSHVKIVAISSLGGQVDVAIQIADLLDENNISLQVSKYCLSACAQYLLTLVDEVEVKPDTAIGYHYNPAGTFLLLLAGGFIEDAEHARWRDLYRRALSSALAYAQHSADPALLFEANIYRDIQCIGDLWTTEGNDGEGPFVYAVELRAHYSYWVPSLEHIQRVSSQNLEGWWPSTARDAQLAFAMHAETEHLLPYRILFGSKTEQEHKDIMQDLELSTCED